MCGVNFQGGGGCKGDLSSCRSGGCWSIRLQERIEGKGTNLGCRLSIADGLDKG